MNNQTTPLLLTNLPVNLKSHDRVVIKDALDNLLVSVNVGVDVNHRVVGSATLQPQVLEQLLDAVEGQDHLVVESKGLVGNVRLNRSLVDTNGVVDRGVVELELAWDVSDLVVVRNAVDLVASEPV